MSHPSKHRQNSHIRIIVKSRDRVAIMSSKRHGWKPSAQHEAPKDALSQQYGGRHSGSWVDSLPASWTPYIQLARLSPPAGVFLIFFPHLFGIVHAAILQRSPISDTLRVGSLVAVGSFFLSNAIHGWNDLIDAPIDRLVTRTRERPIVRGAISPRAAFIFTVSQGLATAAILLALPGITALSTIPSVVANIYYPWSKRHTHFAQMVLGFCLAWGVIVGTAAMDVEPLADAAAPTACLFLASVLWTVIYDTIYACQDVSDDVKIGLKSTAILFREWTKPFLWVSLGLAISLLTAYGNLGGMGLGYYAITVGGCSSSLGTMIMKVNLKDPLSCWWWFRYGFWLAGGSIAGGLLSEYVL